MSTAAADSLATDTATCAAATKPLRADAERNRQRILAAAREVFATRGFEVSLDDIAAHAGVGVGTVYRRFENREAIVEALLRDHLDRVESWVDDALTESATRPWQAFETLMEKIFASMVADRAMMTGVQCQYKGSEEAQRRHDGVSAGVEQIINRAKAKGEIRPDIEADDMLTMAVMMASVIDFSEPVAPNAWRRYFALLLDSVRTNERPALPGTPIDRELAHQAKMARIAAATR